MVLLREHTVCFTGHREIRDGQLREPLARVVESLIHQGFLYFGAGGARGFDTLAADVVLELKAKYPQIHLILVLPFVNPFQRESGWTREEIARHQAQTKKASRVVYTQEAYSRGCYYKRDRHLVDCSSVCVFYQYKASGGTSYTTQYAREQGLNLINCAKSAPWQAAQKSRGC